MLRARAARAPASQQCRRYATAAPASKKKPFERILIANRGEIACRIMRTCKRLGIETIAVYSEPDAGSMHVRKGPAVRSYLDMDAVVRAVKEAVHPGYGFLSENPHFAKALEDINVSFLGPSSYSISQMGDKLQAKSIARAAHVSLVPGHESEVKNNDEVMSAARKIGFPVLLKASRGGGGKGQRICWNEQDLLEGFRLCKQEAMNAFGDDRLLIEKFIEHPRHIEIQILGDGQGNTVFLNERECSIQRRNQKVVEEAPSPFLDKATRDKMGKEAVSLANAVKYRSAGTVEFLVDKNKNHYFLEMNTRLQVEHPVTEYITGLDLVEWMIRIGAGEKLPLRQEDVKINGWAMETRVYGEDPLRNFLPSIGLLTAYKEPPLEDGKVRVDTAIAEGSQISIHYDPLIAKLVTWGANRQECTDRMARALDSYVVRVNNTVDHNVNFLRDVLDAPRFRSGALTTSYIPEEYPKGFHGHQLTPAEKDQLVATAAVSDLLNKRRALKISGQVSAPRSPYPSDEELVVSIGEEDVAVRVVEKKPGEATVHINGKPRTLTYNWDLAEPLFRGALDKGEFVIQPIAGTSLRYSFQHVGTKYDVTVQTKRQKELSKHMLPEVKPDFSSVLRSTMPGKIISVAVKPGDTVQPGQELCIVEAMKMQNVLRATKEAKVKAVVLEPGASVTLDQVIIEFEADPAVAAAKAAAAAAAAAKSAAAAKAPAPKK